MILVKFPFHNSMYSYMRIFWLFIWIYSFLSAKIWTIWKIWPYWLVPVVIRYNFQCPFMFRPLNIKYKSHETKQCSHSGMYICAWVICSRSDTSDFYFPYLFSIFAMQEQLCYFLYKKFVVNKTLKNELVFYVAEAQ